MNVKNIILALLVITACGDGRDHVGVDLPGGNDSPDASPASDAGGNACDCPQDELYCNGVEYCDSSGQCVSTGWPCHNGQICDGDTNQCVGDPVCVDCPSTCSGDVDCNDGLYCNGAERCLDGECRPGVPPTCDDPFVCTIGVCLEGTGCFQVPDSTICNEGEFCSTSSGCTPEPVCPTCPTTPDAGVPECDASPPECVPVDCSDGDICNGTEVWNPSTCSCQHGAPPLNCNDGDSCTTDSCDATLGCQYEPVVCDDGYSCVAGECVCDTPEPECSGHSDCPSDRRKCLDGTCVQCYADWHCGLYSVLPCGDEPCPTPPVCDTDTNTCVYPE